MKGRIYRIERYSSGTKILEMNIPIGYGMVTNPENLKNKKV
jgi:hypothetical protein